MPKLTIVSSGALYHLRSETDDGTQQEMVLSSDDVLALSQSALQLTDHILRSMAPQGKSAVPRLTADVRATILNTDLHKSQIVLTMELSDGLQVSFALPFSVAKPLAERLPARVAEIEIAQSARSSH